MKALPLLLVVSLVANVALLATRSSRFTRNEPDTAASSSTSASAARSANSKAGANTPTDVLSALKADDPEALRDFLRAAGLPDDTVRSIVSSIIWNRYRDRMKALQPKPDPNKPWWKDEPNNWYANTTREQRAELRRLQREASDESTRVLGPDKNNSGRNWQDPRLAFLPEGKRKDLQEVEQDYQDLIQEVQQDMQGLALPSDVEKLRFLQEEKKKDLASMLTPEELSDYDLRMSRTAQQLRWKVSKFDATEDEYRKIFALQKNFDNSQNTDAWGNLINQGPDDWKKRQEGETQLKEQLKVALGDDRYTDYLRSQNYEYQQLQSAVRRLSLPPETATQVFNLRNDISSESKLIAANENLGYDQKKQALVDLANRTRDQVRTRLGTEAADVYLKTSMSWLNNLEQGSIPTFSEDGNANNWSSINDTPKKSSSKK
ncbi:MAG: hypothetical protein WC205_00815 [Opitutaceae bacterium]|jgi:hypothetical protein